MLLVGLRPRARQSIGPFGALPFSPRLTLTLWSLWALADLRLRYSHTHTAHVAGWMVLRCPLLSLAQQTASLWRAQPHAKGASSSDGIPGAHAPAAQYRATGRSHAALLFEAGRFALSAPCCCTSCSDLHFWRSAARISFEHQKGYALFVHSPISRSTPQIKRYRTPTHTPERTHTHTHTHLLQAV